MPKRKTVFVATVTTKKSKTKKASTDIHLFNNMNVVVAHYPEISIHKLRRAISVMKEPYVDGTIRVEKKEIIYE